VSQRKIVDEDEARRLLMDEGWTYQQMIDLYREKYGVETSASVWSRFLKGAGKARIVRTYPLAAPWLVRAKNPRNGHYRTGLRALAAIEHGEDVAGENRRIAIRLRRALGVGRVVDYDWDANAYVLVPRREGIDKWWIRDPFVDDDGEPVADLSRVTVAAAEAHFGM
jgi:hypothetical protein